MKSVVLSTTEAEYMALSEVVKELKFIVQLLQTMNIEVELPITVHVDNVGAILLSNNRTTNDNLKDVLMSMCFVLSLVVLLSASTGSMMTTNLSAQSSGGVEEAELLMVPEQIMVPSCIIVDSPSDKSPSNFSLHHQRARHWVVLAVKRTVMTKQRSSHPSSSHRPLPDPPRELASEVVPWYSARPRWTWCDYCF